MYIAIYADDNDVILGKGETRSMALKRATWLAAKFYKTECKCIREDFPKPLVLDMRNHVAQLRSLKQDFETHSEPAGWATLREDGRFSKSRQSRR